METLGLLLTNGIVLKRALALMQHQASPYLKWHLLLMEFRLSGGRDNIADVLETGLINPSTILRLKVIAKGKGFEQALVRLGRLTGEQNMKRISVVAKIAGGVLLTCGAAFAGFIIFAVYSVGSFVGS